MKALALLSGGLDSTLAVRLMLDQGIEVEALKFTSPFCQCDHGGKCFSAEAARELNIPIKTMFKGDDYLEIVMHPKHGHGTGINPCIDCRIFMLKKAKEYAETSGAQFIFTGEVLGQRPMSQHRRALEIIEKESGLEGKLLRPLCAKHLPESEAEKNGWVDRKRLLDISGRSRKLQFEMAKNFNITSFSCPAGGCLLTDKNFSRRMRDFIDHSDSIAMKDVAILKIGRHFRYNDSKIIVGRNEIENGTLIRVKNGPDLMFVAQECGSPTTILQGNNSEEAVRMAAIMTAAYSDAPVGEVTVLFGQKEGDVLSIRVMKSEKDTLKRYLI